ncbi:hypothetical protein [Zhongshania aquimaris]|uniref:Ig-like domain-containing protein n=1 Tax=Zhongshania aquimaris TaxID=2857107 RepID=A0ABS6VVV7_9GAMM|nr:hypothetical protein [Zhongshania aquimaris]MBW2942462.1 hypothetical protein [Zhongshania aquimaris]
MMKALCVTVLFCFLAGCASQSVYLGLNEGEGFYIPRTNSWVKSDDPNCIDPLDSGNNLCMINAVCIEGNCFDGVGTKRALNEDLTYRGHWYEGIPRGRYEVVFNGIKYEANYCDDDSPERHCKLYEYAKTGGATDGFIRFINGYYVGGVRGSWDGAHFPDGGRYRPYEEGVDAIDRKWVNAKFVFDNQEWEPNTIVAGMHNRVERIDRFTKEFMISVCRSDIKEDRNPKNCVVFYLDTRIGFGEPEYMTYTKANSLMTDIMKARLATDRARDRSKFSYKFRKALRSVFQATSNLSTYATPALSDVSKSMPTVDQTFSSHQNAISTIASSKQIDRSNSGSSNTSDVRPQQHQLGTRQGEAESTNHAAIESSDSGTVTTASSANNSTHIVCGGPFTVPAMNQVLGVAELNSGAASVDYQCPEGGTPVLEGNYNLQTGSINWLLAPSSYKKEQLRDAKGRPSGARVSWDAYRYECLCSAAGPTKSGGNQQ